MAEKWIELHEIEEGDNKGKFNIRLAKTDKGE